jgi:ATP-dependent Clp protease ATP-binding subunit ClpC
LTDSLGRKVDFKNTVIIMTSNLGAREVKDFGNGVGFGTDSLLAQESKNIRSTIEKSLKKAFSPEFLNRVDEIVIFNSLEKEDLKKIIELELKTLVDRTRELGYDVKITAKALSFLCDKGYDKKYGARPLKRAIQKYVEDLLAEEIVKEKLKTGDEIKIDWDGKSENLATNKK